MPSPRVYMCARTRACGCVCVCARARVCICTGALINKRSPPEMPLQAACEKLCGSWELNLSPQREEPKLLNHCAISPALLIFDF